MSEAPRVLVGGVLDFGQWRVVESAHDRLPASSVVQLRVGDRKLGIASTAYARGLGRGLARASVEEDDTLSLMEQVATALSTGSAAALFALDSEYAPFWCPTCGASYCREHYRKFELYDEGFFDCIRGVCPRGHERTLAD